MFPVLLLQVPPQSGTPVTGSIGSVATSVATGTLPPNSQPVNIGCLLIIIGVAGLMGGALNYLRTRTAPDPNPPANHQLPATAERWYWALCLLGGIVAAALIPLFLQTIQSGLLNGDVPKLNYLIFGGLCLLAAVFSNTFIDTLSKRIFDQLSDRIASNKATTQTLAKALSDADEPTAPTNDGPVRSFGTKGPMPNPVEADASLSDVAGNVLASLREGRSPFYSAEALARRTQTDVATVRAALTELLRRDYVLSVFNGETMVYALNPTATPGT